jgi:hypothetical protein
MASKPQSGPKQKKTAPVWREQLVADTEAESCTCLSATGRFRAAMLESRSRHPE